MKQLFIILLTAFSLSAFATTDTAAPKKSEPTTSEHGVKLAKKKDHSKDQKVDATKSPSKDTKKAETPKK